MSRVKLCRSLTMLRVLLAALFLLTGVAGNANAQTSGEPPGSKSAIPAPERRWIVEDAPSHSQSAQSTNEQSIAATVVAEEVLRQALEQTPPGHLMQSRIVVTSVNVAPLGIAISSGASRARWIAFHNERAGYTLSHPPELKPEEHADLSQVAQSKIVSDLWLGESIRIVTRVPPVETETFDRWTEGWIDVALSGASRARRFETLIVAPDGLSQRRSVQYFVRASQADYLLILNADVADTGALDLFENIVRTFTVPDTPDTLSRFALQAVQAELATGFDFPVDPRDGSSGRAPSYASYNARNPYLTQIAPAYGKPFSELQHAGEDWFRGPGSPVYAVANGRVVWAQWANYPGAVVIIEHQLPEGVLTPWGNRFIYSMYGHLASSGLVAPNSDVTKGQRIGFLYDWGSNTHIHWEMRRYWDMRQAPTYVNGYYFANTSIPGPGYTNTDAHPDWFGYTNPSAWVDSHRQATPPNCPQSGGVILYQHADYDCGGAGEGTGYVIRTGSGFQTVPASFDNRASSIRIPSNWSVRLFEHGHQNSPSVCINAPGDPNFTDNYYPGGYSINDTVSAFEVFTAPNCGGGSGGTNRPPNTPSPTSPHDWYVARDGRAPTLCWNNPGDPDGDAVQFFAEVFQSARNAQSGWIYDTCWRPAELDGGYFGYQWRVKARDARGAESGWSAVWHFSIEQGPQPPNTNWQASYWDNRELRGGPRVQTNEGGVYLFRRWEWGAPHGLPGDEWSARFVKRTYFPGGWYTFHCQHDDGCRVFVNGQLLVNAWWDSSFDHHSQGINLPTGEHEVRVEYYEKTGFAALEVWWHGPGYLPDPESCDSNATWCGEYWGNRHLMGRPAIQRREGSSLDLHWGTGGPHATFPGNNFSSRYWRRPYLECGRYRFHVFADDGVRMWVDDVLRLDEWRDQVASFAFDLDMSEGRHTLRVDHYENDGSAAIRVHWEKLSSCPPQVSIEEASTHYVKAGASVDPIVRVRVTQGMLDGSRGDALAWVGGDRLGAGSTAQTVQGVVYNGEQHLFTTMSYPGFRMTAPAGEGTYESVWRIRAAGSEVGSPAVIRVIVDNTPPGIRISNHASGGYLNSSQVLIQAEPQDAYGISQVQFFVGYSNGFEWAWYNLGLDADGSDGWSRVWSASGVGDQRGIALYAYAWDRAGNGAGDLISGIVLDRQPPQTHMLALPPVQESTAIMLNWEAEDAVSGISAFQLQMREGDGPWRHLAELWPSARRLRLFGTLGQSHRFRMRGIDQAGNAEPYPDVAETETYINPCNGDAYEPDNSRYNPRVLYAGVPQRHTFCGLNDEDWVIFWAEQGKRYIIRTHDLAQTESFSTDTVLSLYGPDNSLIAENDDWGSLASYIEWTPTTTGWHLAKVREYLGHLLAGNAVAYTLSFNEARMLYLPSVVGR